MITSIGGYVTCIDLSSWPIPSRSFRHNFAIKLLQYGTLTILDEFFPYLTQMITSMRRCVARNVMWPWHLCLRLYTCDIAYFMDYIHMLHKYNPWEDDVSCTISRSIGQRSHSIFAFFQSGRGCILVDHCSSTSGLFPKNLTCLLSKTFSAVWYCLMEIWHVGAMKDLML